MKLLVIATFFAALAICILDGRPQAPPANLKYDEGSPLHALLIKYGFAEGSVSDDQVRRYEEENADRFARFYMPDKPHVKIREDRTSDKSKPYPWPFIDKYVVYGPSNPDTDALLAEREDDGPVYTFGVIRPYEIYLATYEDTYIDSAEEGQQQTGDNTQLEDVEKPEEETENVPAVEEQEEEEEEDAEEEFQKLLQQVLDEQNADTVDVELIKRKPSYKRIEKKLKSLAKKAYKAKKAVKKHSK